MNKFQYKLLIAGMVSLVLILSGCGSDSGGDGGSVGAVGTGNGSTTGTLNDDGIDTGIAATATTVAGKVRLSSILSQKARSKAALQKALRYGPPGSTAYNKVMAKASQLQKALDTRAITSYSADVAFTGGKVYLYNSSRPAWLYPVAIATTDSTGGYTLEKLINADKNLNADGTAAYSDDGSIPGGNYTLLAFTEKDYGLFKLPDLVALQSVISEFAGNVPGVDLQAQTSTANPTITSMLGVSKNTDGTQTWGDSSLELAPNAAVQVSFGLPMYREAVTSTFLKLVSTDGGAVPAGVWTLSADWLTATFYMDEGVNWEPGKTYTVSVLGSDSESGVAIYSIFGRFLEKTGVGTFKILELAGGQTIADLIDTQSPTATLFAPTTFEIGSPIDVITPIRIASNEKMDVNGLRLRATPSLGAQPSVSFVDFFENVGYVYEFNLGEPLKLATTYDVAIGSGTDLAGNVMKTLEFAMTTVSQTEGVAVVTLDEADEGYAAAVASADAQGSVKDVFGRWVRAFNDHRLDQLQDLMTGEFKLGYNNANGLLDPADVNRDGELSMQEFVVSMTEAFKQWKNCEVKMAGKVIGDINVNTDLTESDFAFTLTATAGIQSPACQQVASDKEYFANLRFVNGGWKINKASEGVDNRQQVEVFLADVELLTPENESTPAFFDEATKTETDVEFKWTEVTDATGYIWMVFDSRNAASGLALILPSNQASINIPGDIEALLKAGTIADVAKEFGFTDRFDPRDGSQLFWQVAALGSYSPSDVSSGRAADLPGDVVAKSELWDFSIPGSYETLNFAVAPNSSTLKFFKDSKNTASTYEERLDGTDEAATTFDEFIFGFNVGDSSFATISFSTSDTTIEKGFVQVEGNTRIERVVKFVNGTASVTVPLNQGINQVMVSNSVPCWRTDSCSADSEDQRGIEEWFQIETTGGIQPIIFFGDGADMSGVTTVDAAGTETVLDNNIWNWFESTDAVTLKLTGSVNLTAPALNGKIPKQVRLDVGSESGARATMKVAVDASTGAFSADIQVFQGDNWVSVGTSICTVELTGEQECEDWQKRRFTDQFGVRTDVGSVYTAPISNVVVTNTADATVLIQNENWGNGGRWDASAVTGNQITITGVMDDTSGSPRYSAGSDGGWLDEQLSVAPDGSFSFTVDLYNGDNWIDIRDNEFTGTTEPNNFNLNVFTSLGKAVVKPILTKIVGADGVTEIALPAGDLITDQCSITLTGTAMEGNIEGNWNGQKEVQVKDPATGDLLVDDAGNPMMMIEWFGERFMSETTLVGSDYTFSITVNLVGDPTAGSNPPGVFAENWIEVFDGNWNRLGMRVISTGNCDYVAPELRVTTVKDSAGNALVKRDDFGQGGFYVDASSTTNFAKAFPGSVGLEVFSPVDGATGLGAGTMINGNVDLSLYPMTGSEVLRITMSNPTTGAPVYFWSSRSDDPFFLGGASTFTIDMTTGDYSTLIDIPDPNQGWVVRVVLFADFTVDPKTASPIAGHEIAINGAVLPIDDGTQAPPADGTQPPPADGSAPPPTDGGIAPSGGDGGGNQGAVTTDNISVEGTTNIAGGDVTIELDGCGGAERYTVTAETSDGDGDGWYNWVSDPADPIIVYNGRNRIQVRNGPMQYHIELDAKSDSMLPEPALVITVAAGGSDLTEYVDPNKPAECGRSAWDAGAASTVTITGTTTAPDGKGEWRADGVFGQFEIVSGAFTIENVALFNGTNRFELNDTRWNRHELYIETTGGGTRPQYVTLETYVYPIGAATLKGTIYGTATDGNGKQFNARDVSMSININDMNYEFVTNPQELQWRPNAIIMQLMPVAGSTTGDFTFTVDIVIPADPNDASSGAQGWLNIWAGGEDESGQWADHGINTSINDKCTGSDCGGNTNFWKAKR